MRRRLASAALGIALGCSPYGSPRPEFPGDESDPALYAAIAELELGDEIVDPNAVCRAGPRTRPNPRAPSCRAPEWLALDRPELRDLRRERLSFQLSSAARYRQMVRRLEGALVRSRPRTPARKKLLGWLVTAHTRLRESGAPHPCLLDYLGAAVDEVGYRKRSPLRYTYALELESAGEHEAALGGYRVVVAEGQAGPAFSAAHAALGDHAFRQSFCDRDELATAHDHYLVAAHGPAPRGAPFAGYARLRLAQVELELGALGPALRQLEAAEADGIHPRASGTGGWSWHRLRSVLDLTTHALAERALADGTLRLLLAFEPPGASMCEALGKLARQPRDPAELEDLERALDGPCSFTSYAERR